MKIFFIMHDIIIMKIVEEVVVLNTWKNPS